MALLLKRSLDAYRYLKEDIADPRTQDWFLVKSPVPIIFIGIIYLMLIYEWLPKFMENRKPFNLRKMMIAYNLLQIALSGYIVIQAYQSLFTLNIFCSPVDYSYDYHAMNLAKLTWVYFMVKMVDLLDTIFFILRKKFNQASFLHVYHHCGVLIVGWVGTKYIAGGESIYLGLINSLVHIVMYTYYMYVAWKPENREKINFWKKYITQLQLVQFLILYCIYFPKIFTDCTFPKFPLIIVVPQNLSMILLFGDFYYKTYIVGNKNKNT